MKKIVYIFCLIGIIASSCKKDTAINNNDSTFDVDLTAIYNNNVSSYKINSDGEVTILVNETNKNGTLYKSVLSEKEIDSIQSKLIKITSVKCDSIKEKYADGIRYVMILTNKKNEKLTLIGNDCKGREELDELVVNIIKKFDKEKKNEVFESLRRLTPPPFPN